MDTSLKLYIVIDLLQRRLSGCCLAAICLALCPNSLACLFACLFVCLAWLGKKPRLRRKYKGHLLEPVSQRFLHHKRQGSGKTDTPKSSKITRAPRPQASHHAMPYFPLWVRRFLDAKTSLFLKSAKSSATKGVDAAQERSQRTSETNQSTSRGRQERALLHRVPQHRKQAGRAG